jgi:hypothetical protein
MPAKRKCDAISLCDGGETDAERRSSGESTISRCGPEEGLDALVDALVREGLSKRQCQIVQSWYSTALNTDPLVIFLQDPTQHNGFSVHSPTNDALADIRVAFGTCPNIDVIF